MGVIVKYNDAFFILMYNSINDQQNGVIEMYKSTITEIRNYLKAKGATLEKQRATLNGQAMYKIEFADGSWKKRALSTLKTEYALGVL